MQSKWKWKWNVFRILFSVRKIWRASDVFSVFVYWMTICFVYLLWYWNCVSVLFQCLTHFFTNLYVYMYYVRLSISLTVWVIVCVCKLKTPLSSTYPPVHFEFDTIYIPCILIGEYSCLKVDLLFKREFSYYLIQIYIPCCMLVIVSWVSFWLDQGAVPARVSLGKCQ